MLPFGLTIFWGAFLLFLVQPLIAKFILPWFGGSAAVWTTCMLFFQVLLLGGYAGAHLLVTKLTPRRQVLVYLGALALALLCLPIQPSDFWKPVDDAYPAARILLLLGATLGLPYLVLSATGPLMQSWFSGAYAGVSPWRLYAVSNVASLLALAAYPLFLERYLPRGSQALVWSVGLGIFAAGAAVCGRIVWRRAATPTPVLTAADDSPEPAQPRWLWFALPACASVLLLAVTNSICQDVAVIPFLWVLPLVVYLLTFIISFDSPRWYQRAFWGPAFVVAVAALLWVLLSDKITPPTAPWLQGLAWLLRTGNELRMPYRIAVYVGALFVCCMICHGEVFRLRPSPKRLSGYYLLISAGGAFGGFFVAVIAPLIFRDYVELHLALAAVAILYVAVLMRDPASRLYRGQPHWAFALVLLGLFGTAYGAYFDAEKRARGALEMSRSFFGVLRMYELAVLSKDEHRLVMQHGGTRHGQQFVSPAKRRLPTAYYVPESGIGRAMQVVQRPGGRRVGIVGLGTGTLATYGQPGDVFRYYEIDRDVERLARTRFTYLKDSKATIEVTLGDARLSMEREQQPPFDLLVLDAFSSDSVPVHLVTREAFEIYLRRLNPDGIIAVHVTNRFLKLEPIILAAADHFHLAAAYIPLLAQDAKSEGAFPSKWMLLSRDPALLQQPAIAEAARDPRPGLPAVSMWTDDYSNLLPILKFK